MSLPFVFSEAVWSAKAASETVELKSEFERCQVVIVEITTAAFSGTIDIQGKIHEISAFANVPYIRQDQAGIQTPSVAQISHSLNTSVIRYVILGYWRRLQLVMTRTAGTITCGVGGSSDALSFPYLVTKLIANSGVDIGDVDILSIASGTNVIGKVGHDKTGIGHGVKVVTTAGTDVPLVASSTPAKVVILQAQTDNTGAIAAGATGVDATIATGDGIILYAGDSMALEVDDLADVYIDAIVSGEGVRFVYLT